jgi:lysophospholipase L1-like esterase
LVSKLVQEEVEADMKIVVIGDSIAQGLGVPGQSFGVILAHKLASQLGRPVRFINMADNARQITVSRKLLPELISLNPELIIIAHGTTESLLRPPDAALRYVPVRWRRPGWLDPRPYYSRKLLRRIGQKLESAIRWRVKLLLMRSFGGEPWMAPERFESELSDYVRILLNSTTARIVLLSPYGIDASFFPGSPERLEQCKETIARIPWKFKNKDRLHFVDVSQVCRRWEDYLEDRFHPNEFGHERIADRLFESIRSIQWEREVTGSYEHFGNRYGLD